MSAAQAAPRQDAKVLGLIGIGHFLSHFYLLCLPPLFPLLKGEFGVSYTALGLIMTVIYATSGVAQTPVGFLVDRFGAGAILAVGLALLSAAMGLISQAPRYEAVLGLAVIAGIGHSVFHPADYAILSSAIKSERVARAFSLHTFSGHLGSAVAPATVIFLTSVIGWRSALLVLAGLGFVVMLAMLSQRRALVIEARPKADAGGAGGKDAAPTDGWRLLFSAPIMLFFLFFVVTSMTSGGIQTFSVAALSSLHETPLAAASTALTGFLFASAIGVLVGGQAADRTRRHDLIAAAAFLGTAGAMVLIGAVRLPMLALVGLFTVMGFAQGMVRPARDMLVRAATPKGSAGKGFGFVSTGIAVGGATAPVLFGWIVDQGRPQWTFYLIAAFMLVGVICIVAGRRRTEAAALRAGEPGKSVHRVSGEV